MAKAFKKCKVCGCEYEYCHTLGQTENIFRWQDVACSPEHGSIYFARIEASRGKTSTKKEEDYNTILDFDDGLEYDELFEEDFDDSDEEPVVYK